MKPLKLCLHFGDNDFSNTFLPLLRELGEGYRFNEIEYTLEQYVEIINSLSFGFYILYQNNFRYSCSQKDLNSIREYLKISQSQLSFENRTEWNNGETFNLYCDEYNLATYSN